MINKLGHHRVLYADLHDYREIADPENTSALCSHCDEFKGATTPCSESCGPAFVWVDGVTFVKLRLEGFSCTQ